MVKWILGPAAALLLAWLFWKVRGVLLTPVCRGKNQRLKLSLHVSGPSPELEATVDGLAWLLADGVLFGEIEIWDDGMDAETGEIARRLASGRRNVTVWTRDTDAPGNWS